MRSDTRVQLNDVSYSYEEQAAPALSDVSAVIQPGEFVAVLGHNGSGKSTMAKLLNALYIPTEGNVLDAVRAAGIQADVICACGPMPMLRAVRDFARETGAACYISLEERMACGIGACLGCITKTRQTDAHSHVRNARICTEGPVFAAEEIDF